MARAELRVYPNLFDERKNVAALFLRRGQLGIHAHRMAGQGREMPGNDAGLPGDGRLGHAEGGGEFSHSRVTASQSREDRAGFLIDDQVCDCLGLSRPGTGGF